MPIITGTRVILRPYQPDDAQILLDATSNPVVRRLTGTQHSFTLAQIQRYIASSLDADDRAGFIITDAASGAPVGEIVLMDIDDLNRSAALRIAIFNEQDFGKGFGTDALRLVVGYGFEQRSLHRISLDVFDFNPRAVHVYEKIGFRREGTQRDTLFYEGAFHSSIMMAIFEDDWRQP